MLRTRRYQDLRYIIKSIQITRLAIVGANYVWDEGEGVGLLDSVKKWLKLKNQSINKYTKLQWFTFFYEIQYVVI